MKGAIHALRSMEKEGYKVLEKSKPYASSLIFSISFLNHW